MHKHLRAFLLLAILLLAPSLFVYGDTINLKNGQAHKGEITAEEENRVQMKVDGSGARVWFMRDQILSIEKDTPKETPEDSKKDASDPPGGAAATGDDVTRAQELLDKMREQPKETPSVKKKPVNPGPAIQSEKQASPAPVAANQGEVDKLIEQLRNGQYYDRLAACEKLGTPGSMNAVPHLIQVLDDADYSLRKTANESLIKITGQNFGFDSKAQRSVRLWSIEKWQKWYKEEQKKEAHSKFKLPW